MFLINSVTLNPKLACPPKIAWISAEAPITISPSLVILIIPPNEIELLFSASGQVDIASIEYSSIQQ